MTLSLRERLEMAAKNSDSAIDMQKNSEQVEEPTDKEVYDEPEEALESGDVEVAEDVEEIAETSGNAQAKPVEDIKPLVEKVLAINDLLKDYDTETISYIQNIMHEDSRSGLISCIITIDKAYSDNILKLKELFSLRGTTDLAFAVIEMQDISGLAKLVEGYNPSYTYDESMSSILAKKNLTKGIETLPDNVLDKMLPLLELLEVARG